MATFKKVFIDHWKKASITSLIKKLELSFQVEVNNEIKYPIAQKKILFN